jgi:hypothetical protein
MKALGILLVFQITMVLISLGLVACGQEPNDILEGPPMFKSVDPALQQYFDYFYRVTELQPTGITAGFTPLPNGIAGECVWGGAYNEVRINSNYWTATSGGWGTIQNQQLISHELGHCALHLYHINNCSDGTNAPDGTMSSCNNGGALINGVWTTVYPLSIMNWMMFNPTQANYLTSDYLQYYQALVGNVPILWQ